MSLIQVMMSSEDKELYDEFRKQSERLKWNAEIAEKVVRAVTELVDNSGETDSVSFVSGVPFVDNKFKITVEHSEEEEYNDEIPF